MKKKQNLVNFELDKTVEKGKRVVHRVTTSGTTKRQRVTTNDKE